MKKIASVCLLFPTLKYLGEREYWQASCTKAMPHVMLQTQPTISRNVASCRRPETMLRRHATTGRPMRVVVPQQNTLNADTSVPVRIHTHTHTHTLSSLQSVRQYASLVADPGGNPALAAIRSVNKTPPSVCSPDVWNSLPPSVRTVDSNSSFRLALKTHLFPLAFNN